MIKEHPDWDEELSEQESSTWRIWFRSLPKLSHFSIPRCFYPSGFGQIQSREIHYFTKASNKGYGFDAFLRVLNTAGKVWCSFLYAKARISPPKAVTIPRLELVAAVLTVKADKWLQDQLCFDKCHSTFWIDSSAVRLSFCSERK